MNKGSTVIPQVDVTPKCHKGPIQMDHQKVAQFARQTARCTKECQIFAKMFKLENESVEVQSREDNK